MIAVSADRLGSQRQSVRLQTTSRNRQVAYWTAAPGPLAWCGGALTRTPLRKGLSSGPLLLMAFRYRRKAANAERTSPIACLALPRPLAADSSPPHPSPATPQTGQTQRRLAGVGATLCRRADNDDGGSQSLTVWGLLCLSLCGLDMNAPARSSPRSKVAVYCYTLSNNSNMSRCGLFCFILWIHSHIFGVC